MESALDSAHCKPIFFTHSGYFICSATKNTVFDIWPQRVPYFYPFSPKQSCIWLLCKKTILSLTEYLRPAFLVPSAYLYPVFDKALLRSYNLASQVSALWADEIQREPKRDSESLRGPSRANDCQRKRQSEPEGAGVGARVIQREPKIARESQKASQSDPKTQGELERARL